MRILLLNQFFYPDVAATSQLLTDLALDLVARGHQVRVIAGSSTYAASGETHCVGVDVVRISTPRFRKTTLGRLASHAAYFTGVLYRTLTGPKVDCIVTMTTPPGLSVIGSLMKRLRDATHICWEMDIYPDVAVELGVLPPKRPITRLASYLLDSAVRNSNAVIALGPCMERRLVAKGVPMAKVSSVENWADSALLSPRPFPDGPLTVVYSGNLGLAHEIETVKDVLPFADTRWIFAGGGPLRSAFESFCGTARLANVSFRPYCALDQLGDTLAAGHIGLVTQTPASLGTLVPSKTYGIMACGRPVLFIGPRDATPSLVIARHRCGWQVDPGDSAGLLALLRRLNLNRGEVIRAGAAARRAFLDCYDKPVALERLHRVVCAGTVPPPWRQPLEHL